MIEQEAMEFPAFRTLTAPCRVCRVACRFAGARLLLPGGRAPRRRRAAPAGPAKAAAPPPAEAPKAVAPPQELASLAWLEGCWRGEVAQYEFREHWLPLRGGLMVGAGHVVFQGKTQDYGYLRLETRPDGVYYVSISLGPRRKPRSSWPR